MKTTGTIDDLQWEQLIQNTAKYFDDITIKRGFQYFKQQRVLDFKMPDAVHIQAVVEGTEDYYVKINLDSLSESRCDCPVNGSCKHMVAVLLQYADLQDRPIPALANARSLTASAQTGKASAAAAGRKPNPPDDRKAQAKAKLMEQASRIDSMSVPEWHELFELCTAELSDNTYTSQYVKDALASIRKIKPPLPPFVEQLLGLHAHLFVLGKLIKQSQSQWSAYYMGFHTHVAADDVQEAIVRILSGELAGTAGQEPQSGMAGTLAYLRRQMLTESPKLHYYSRLYDLLWRNWLHPARGDTKMYAEELDALQAAAPELGAALSKLPWMLARCRMHFLMTQDQEAWELLREASSGFDVRPDDLYPFLSDLAEAEQWQRLVDWLAEISPLLTGYRRDGLTQYAVYWETALEQLPDSEPLMWQTLAGMLPYSRDIYEEALLAHAKWREWMDYHLSAGREPLDFRVSVFQPIEKHAPEMLLPFYHQAVERYIIQKNRDSYKAAVKLLKRLFKLYKKTKQESRWELFLTAFTDRHSRLRALQEELRKGKLIP